MRRETKVVGWFALALGCTSILAAVSILSGGASQPEGLSCKALCGLALLTTEMFGDFAGTIVGGVLWLAVGAVFCLIGYRVLKS
jgi:hypothetical protein